MFNAVHEIMRIPATTVTLTLLLLLGGAVAVPPAQAAASDHAPSKQRLCKPCAMPRLPMVLPRQGMVLVHGSLLGTSSPWYMADLERDEASRILASDDRTANRIDIVEHTTRAIPPDELAALKRIAIRIWASPNRLPTHMATDVAWVLWQLDGDDVRRDDGPGLADGLAKHAEQIIERLVGMSAPSSACNLRPDVIKLT